MSKRKAKTSRRRKPIGFVKVGKSFKMAFGTEANPRMGRKLYRTKKTLNLALKKLISKKKK